MRAKTAALLVVTLLGAVSHAAPSEFSHGKPRGGAMPVSAFQLVAGSETLSGRRIQVEGVLRFEDYGDCLYPSKEAARYRLATACVLLTFDYEALGTNETELSAWDEKYVLVEGSLLARERGVYSYSPGELREVTYVNLNPVEYWSSAEEEPVRDSAGDQSANSRERGGPPD